ncbi:hypothetical protein CO657_11035 [Rhizobium acidisoli]|uniref:Uncharacterized protein n=1 Tax=Rhizobium acidisoli TaxID=1538158 RepID=A0AAE5WPP6_9HYPH|nr:hypothetical protein [Rhizobium acidisoli]QAS78572.1 hypothetical protein CO657_11035 [Rhizobium acidisoli]
MIEGSLMPRRVLEASLTHMSPLHIGVLHRQDGFRSGVGIMPYGQGFLFQAARVRMSHLDGREILWDAPGLWNRAVSEGYSHLWLHADGPEHEAPIFDRTKVLDAFERPPFDRKIDDSGRAGVGFERLHNDRKKFRATPKNFEREIENDLTKLRQHVDNEVFDVELYYLLERTYNLVCGAEWAKENGNSRWAACDFALRSLADCLLALFEKVADAEGVPLSIEEMICGLRGRVLRNLRMTKEWRALAA